MTTKSGTEVDLGEVYQLKRKILFLVGLESTPPRSHKTQKIRIGSGSRQSERKMENFFIA